MARKRKRRSGRSPLPGGSWSSSRQCSGTRSSRAWGLPPQFNQFDIEKLDLGEWYEDIAGRSSLALRLGPDTRCGWVDPGLCQEHLQDRPRQGQGRLPILAARGVQRQGPELLEGQRQGQDPFLVTAAAAEQQGTSDKWSSKGDGGRDIEKGLGRLQWATTCCPLTKSLLQPFGPGSKLARHQASPVP